MKEEKSKQLLFRLSKEQGDFIMQVFKCGGHGGQNLQKNCTGVRIIHPASGAVGESREERSQLQNKKNAFLHLVESDKFKSWHRVRTAAALQGIKDFEKEIQRKVEEMMKEENLRIEYYDPDEKNVRKGGK